MLIYNEEQVAQIIPLNPAGCNDCDQRVVAFNKEIPTWAASLSTTQSPIKVVDQYSGWVSSTDTYDGVHPNENGNVKMAARWFQPLLAWV